LSDDAYEHGDGTAGQAAVSKHPEHSVIALGEFELNLGMRALYKAGREVPLGSRAFDILSVIVLAAGRIVSKDELMDTVWPGVFVEENNIHVHLSAVRKALGDHRQLIDTIPGRGYRLKVFDDPPAEPARDVPTERHAPHFRNADAMTAPRHRLPGRRTLLGRAAALDEIEGQFARSRVVTLTGPGGVGKTCLAIEHAHRTIATGASDVVFIDLEEADRSRPSRRSSRRPRRRPAPCSYWTMRSTSSTRWRTSWNG
jgi:DNA-binding winged helix-turn-helix (wHTH) protein